MDVSVMAVSDIKDGKPWMMCRCVHMCVLIARRWACVLCLSRASPEGVSIVVSFSPGQLAPLAVSRCFPARPTHREEWISLKEAKSASYADGEAGDFEKMADYLKSKAPNAVIFDTTAAEPVWSAVPPPACHYQRIFSSIPLPKHSYQLWYAAAWSGRELGFPAVCSNLRPTRSFPRPLSTHSILHLPRWIA